MTVLACDMGGRRIKLGLVQGGEVLAAETIPAHSDRPLVERLEAVAATLRALCASRGLPVASARGVGMAFPSILDAGAARILDAWGKFPGCEGFDLRGWAREALGLPLAAENDARMALAGEWRRGAARGRDDVVLMTLGTGIGTAAIVGGRLLRGRHGQAGCLGGHLVARVGGRPCVCGNVGCAEAEASTSVLEELARASPEFDESDLSREATVDYAAVFRFAAEGDSLARALRDHALAVWSAVAVNLVHAYDPEVLVLGGGIMASGEVILPAIREHVHRHAHTAWGKVRVVASELGDGAALVGCEWLVGEMLGSRAGSP